MGYKKIQTEAGLKLDFSNLDKVINAESPFWKRLEKAGAQLKGTEDIFPAVFSNGEVRKITYQVRRAATESGALDVGGYTYLEAYEDQNSPFWGEVELPSALQFWGIFSAVRYNGKILLGKKKPKIMDISAVFGSTFDNIGGGIVDISDYQQNETFQEALLYASFRELSEEAPGAFKKEDLEFAGMHEYFDPDRVKQDALIVWDLKTPVENIVFPAESEEFVSFDFYSKEDIANNPEMELSPHAKQTFEELF